MLKIASLFSGVGTPEQSLKHLNVEHETVFACEIDKYARKTYLANNQEPNTFYEDVYTIDGNKYKNQIDILVGGSPCQSFSIAGKRKGIADARGNLIYEYFRIVEETQPKVFIYENVKGFLSIDKQNKKDKYGETFKNFLQSFKDLGYTTYHQVLNTKDYGIPQNRERIYIVGFKDEVDFHFQEKQELKLRLKDMLEDMVNEKYHLTQKAISYMDRERQGKPRWEFHKNEINGEASCLTANMYKGVLYGVIAPHTKAELIHTHNLDIKGNDSIKRIYSSEGLCPSLTTMQGGHREPKVAISFAQRGRYNEDGSTSQKLEFGTDVSNSITTVQKDSYVAVENGLIEVENDEVKFGRVDPKYHLTDKASKYILDAFKLKKKFTGLNGEVSLPLMAQYNQSKNGTFLCVDSNGRIDGESVGAITQRYYKGSEKYGGNPFLFNKQNYVFRKLTPRECFRLQGFDDSFIFPEKMSDTQLYKQAGNGMSRNILDMIFTQILVCYTKHIEEVA